MMKIIANLFSKGNPETDFSVFFNTASSREKKKLLTEVVREANNDQKRMVEKYDEAFAKTV